MKDKPSNQNEVEKAVMGYLRRADEAMDMFYRAGETFPIAENPNVKKFQADLGRRWKEKDPHVAAYCEDEKGQPTRFELEFTKDERKVIINDYLAARNWDGFFGGDKDKNYEANVFTGIIEGHASMMPVSDAIMPPKQKDRQRSVEAVANAFDRFTDSLNDLDSAALGWVFALAEEHAAKIGETLRTSGPDIPTLRNYPIRSMVEAGEIRQAIDAMARAIGPAIREAAKTLPKAERNDNDPRLHAAFAMERILAEHHIPFETRDSGFAASCLRAMLDLAGYLDDTETVNVSYWLKKVANTPDNEVPWFGAIRKNEG